MASPLHDGVFGDRWQSVRRAVRGILLVLPALVVIVAVAAFGSLPAAAHPHHHSHEQVASIAATASLTAMAPTARRWQTHVDVSILDHTASCPNRCLGDCDPDGSCCASGCMTLLGIADADSLIPATSRMRPLVLQEHVLVSGIVYLIPRPPNHVV